jgi:hypothetical protein
VSLTVLVFAGFVPMFALAYRAPGVASARELYDLSFGLLAVSGVPTALALASYAVIAVRASEVATWTGWVAVLGAVAHVVIAASFLLPSGFFSLEGGVIVAVPVTLFLWILATSLSLVYGDRAAAHTRAF